MAVQSVSNTASASARTRPRNKLSTDRAGRIIIQPVRLQPVEEVSMKVYLLSLGAGLLVGIVYSLLNVRSPAPPVIALVGLLGILV